MKNTSSYCCEKYLWALLWVHCRTGSLETYAMILQLCQICAPPAVIDRLLLAFTGTIQMNKHRK